jgi:type II secretory pathway pseudopilin PulG
MKKYLRSGVVILVAVLLLSVTILYNLWQKERKEAERQSSNVATLSTKLNTYKLHDSLNVVSTGGLLFTPKELKSYRPETKKTLKDLGIKSKDVESISNTKIVTGDTIPYVLKDSCFNYNDKWCRFHACVKDSTFVYSVSDSIMSTVHRIYKHHLLWWRWGTKGYKLTIVNFNPHSHITYSDFIKME